MSKWKKWKLRTVMRFARWMGVPVDVHSSYFGLDKPQGL